ncbi:phospholipase C type enzyme [Dissophora globulifera]|uniref:Phospholipase C type enzyme n=1 Tax=Dissophora globulifera TaxID=979702 RepID=A0A9P6UYE5_9FUNG|nr:phospholipase C type enzyme [Dissophora globulifera]
MNEPSPLSVLTLNCWGLTFTRNDRRDRMRAIGHHLASTESSTYDIVGLQEVWAYEDFVLVRDIVSEAFPFAKHWMSGLFGSGLVVLSKYPIKSTSLRRYALNGDPWPILHGDWFDGKSCASAVILHPTVGEIEVFNTHMHASYDPIGTPDRYLGCRISQAWEMAGLIRTANDLGRHVIALGDFNSPPDSLIVSLLTRYAGLADSWRCVHPYSQDPQSTLPRGGLTPEQGIALLGITCDTPLNSWTPHAAWINQLTEDPIGERLDYIFFNQKQGRMACIDVKVALHEPVAGIGGLSKRKNLSDHFAVHATFSVTHGRPRSPQIQQQDVPHHRSLSTPVSRSTTDGEGNNEADVNDEDIELLERVRLALEQHLIKAQKRSTRVLAFLTPFFLLVTLGLLLGMLWVDHVYYDNGDNYADADADNNRTRGRHFSSNPSFQSSHRNTNNNTLFLMSMAIGLSISSSCWVASLLYGFFYGGETISGFVNAIQEVQAYLEGHHRGYNNINIG